VRCTSRPPADDARRHRVNGLRKASLTSLQQVSDPMEAFVAFYNPTAEPFQWRKRDVTDTPLKKKYGELCD
jgi:hypothetical protein